MRRIKLRSTIDGRLRSQFERDLNPEQRAAATAPDGANLILAGPGSGKTRVITYRVAYLIAKGIAPESILLVTFTRRAAREMVSRLEALIGTQAAKVWAGTFHHVGNRILRGAAETLGYGKNFTILDSEDAEDLIKMAISDAGLVGTGKLTPKPATIGHLIIYAFNVARPLEEVISERSPDLLVWLDQILQVEKSYAERKLQSNCMDYDDLLSQWAKLIKEHPSQLETQAKMFAHILIDEMQDTNIPQVALIETIATAGLGNLTAVGDDAQSIYRFRGANYDNILKFPERHPGANVFKLETNYRSTPEIVAFTNASIAHNKTGFHKQLVSARAPGLKPLVVPTADVYEESEFLCQQILDLREAGNELREIAVLYRNHHDSIVLQGDLVTRGIPYVVRSGVRFFEQAHIKDVLSYLRIIVNQRDEPAWRRLLLLLPGIGPAKAASIWQILADSSDAFAAIASKAMMDAIPIKSRGMFAAFIADLRKIQASRPETEPAGAIAAILAGGYPSIVKSKYERADNRIADIEQMGVLAAKYDNLERLIADLVLSGEHTGQDTLEGGEPGESLILSSIHQAKGLEWAHVFIPRLVDDGFPNARALNELEGEEEERRIFYVGVTRAKDELTLTYPLSVTRGGRGPNVITKPSRFLTEIPADLSETAILESEDPLAWTAEA